MNYLCVQFLFCVSSFGEPDLDLLNVGCKLHENFLGSPFYLILGIPCLLLPYFSSFLTIMATLVFGEAKVPWASLSFFIAGNGGASS
jgi:hypothetical protein